eukprot:TRINITY_DN1714_c0_g1_i1.p1 TRINITY_DN1714_c0_g1~~TRINITY_DN1714_c0_g1_i1.p1  ORF type:complete len:255 (+),score=46.26 TRINITY_DN1714_c0_g1_i1:127-891(+)
MRKRDGGNWELFMYGTADFASPTSSNTKNAQFRSPRELENRKAIRTVIPSVVFDEEKRQSIRITNKTNESNPGNINTLIARTGDDSNKVNAKAKRQEAAFRPQTIDSSVNLKRELKSCTLKTYDYQSAISCLPTSANKRSPEEFGVYKETGRKTPLVAEKAEKNNRSEEIRPAKRLFIDRLATVTSETMLKENKNSDALKPNVTYDINPYSKGVKRETSSAVFQRSKNERELDISRKGKPRIAINAFQSNFDII